MRRLRKAKIIATLGPASSDPKILQALYQAGADVFRLNLSHGSLEEHGQRIDTIRQIESEFGRPIAILLDMQGPKLRVGKFENDGAELRAGAPFKLRLDEGLGDQESAHLPHPEVFEVLNTDSELLIDDGRIRLRVTQAGRDFADTVVVAGGPISNNKGVNVPDVLLPIPALTERDKEGLAYGLERGVDWVAPSFVQRPDDLVGLRDLVVDRAMIITKFEKPAALEHLRSIVALSDAIMVARGDLGVEMPPERVPAVQKQLIRACRHAGKPVVVATQMLESMVNAPIPTRAEASDVATAVYDGADAVMLSAESAAGQYPVEAVAMMNRILEEVEKDAAYLTGLDAQSPEPQATSADAISDAMRHISRTLPAAATVTFTSSGFSALRTARERPSTPILGLTPTQRTARRLALVWGVHSIQVEEIHDIEGMVELARRCAVEEGFAVPGDTLIIVAGMPFGVSGTTNMIRIARIPEH